MNNPLIPTVISWQTRSHRQTKSAAKLCHNFGLSPLTTSLFIGRINKKECAILHQEFSQTFTNKTDKYYIIPLCKSCYESTSFYLSTHKQIENKTFTIIE